MKQFILIALIFAANLQCSQAACGTIRKGSRGDCVKQLQQALRLLLLIEMHINNGHFRHHTRRHFWY
jgi:hypothetical protein